MTYDLIISHLGVPLIIIIDDHAIEAVRAIDLNQRVSTKFIGLDTANRCFYLLDKVIELNMQLYGSVLENLENALVSSRRLRGHPVYHDTLVYWRSLVAEARRARQDPSCKQVTSLEAAILELETELAARAK